MPIFITDKSKSVLPSIYDEIYAVYFQDGLVPISVNIPNRHTVNDIYMKDSTTSNQISGVFETYIKQGDGASGEWLPTLYEDKIYKIISDGPIKKEGFYYIPKGVFHIEITIHNTASQITNVDMWFTNWSSDTEYTLVELQTYDPTISVSNIDSNTIIYHGVNVKPFMYMRYVIDSPINPSKINYIIIKQQSHILETIT